MKNKPLTNKQKYKQKYYQDNKERLLKKQIEYRKANKEELDKKRKEYYEANRESQIEYSLKWRENNLEKSMQRQRDYYYENVDEKRAKARAHYQTKKAYIVAKKYGLTEEEYLQMFIDRDNKCDVCGTEAKGKRLAVDHNHLTGQVRGLLCQICNTGIGALKTDENLDIIKKAIEYLESNNG